MIVLGRHLKRESKTRSAPYLRHSAGNGELAWHLCEWNSKRTYYPTPHLRDSSGDHLRDNAGEPQTAAGVRRR